MEFLGNFIKHCVMPSVSVHTANINHFYIWKPIFSHIKFSKISYNAKNSYVYPKIKNTNSTYYCNKHLIKVTITKIEISWLPF